MIYNGSKKYQVLVHILYQDCGYPESPEDYVNTELTKLEQAANVIKEDSFGFWCNEHNLNYKITNINESDRTITIVVDKSNVYTITDMLNDLQTLDDDGNHPVYHNRKIYLVRGQIVGCVLLDEEEEKCNC
jgi:hypothetical protein